ncbi:MAG: tetratricopeptide repeat protein [Planctomycetota bacterium]
MMTTQRWITTVACLLLTGAGLLAHASTWQGGWTFDDYGDIVNNNRVHDLGNATTIITRARRPLTELTFAVNYAIGELNPVGYHLINIAIHLITGISLFMLFRMLLAPIGAARERPMNELAFLIALLWIVHPISTSTVTYTVQRAEAMASMWYVLGMLTFMIGLQRPKAWPWFAITIACSALGLASKAIVVTLPVMLLLLMYAYGRDGASSRRARWVTIGGTVMTWSVMWFTRVAPGVLSTDKATATAGFSYQGITPWDYLLTQSEVLLHGLRLTVLPNAMSLDYQWPPATSIGDVIVPAIIILALLAATVYLLVRHRHVGVLAAWFFIILAPTSTIVPIRDLANDHRFYLAIAGVIATLGVMLWCIVPKAWLPSMRGRTPALVALLLVVGLATTFSVMTFKRASMYAQEITLWRDVLAKNPENPRALLRVGQNLEALGDAQQSAAQNYAAVDDTVNAQAFATRALAFHQNAESYYQRAIDIWPDYTEAHLEFGDRLRLDGRSAAAITAYESALEFRRRNEPRKASLAAFGIARSMAYTPRS